MIAGLILAARSWRVVGWSRCVTAAMTVLSAEIALGAVVAALLGVKVGAR